MDQIYAQAAPRVIAGSKAAGRVVLEPQEGKRTMRVAYFFSGMSRKAFIGEKLLKFCAKAGLGLVVDEIDIVNGGKSHDLFDRDAQFDSEAMATGGEYDLIILSQPCTSWSRA